MLNRKHVVVADHAEIGNEITPPRQRMAVADGAECPRAMQNVAVGFGIKCTVDRGVVGVNAGVFGMDMEDRAGCTQHAYGGNRVNALPPKMRRVKVCADLRPGGVAEPEQGFGVVDQKVDGLQSRT